ncbi:hypothetical protein MLD38_015244 [Melastoma candidum]|uniref:Uncharacterized protein n=1 Tax=Melastoma candidum TaxID=119954 RepID=A0ACB9RFL1_9MYRT|nr:hypothetical protein MLD38_015244 [Melastoma candidum]
MSSLCCRASYQPANRKDALSLPSLKPLWDRLQVMPLREHVFKAVTMVSEGILDVAVDSVFKVTKQPMLPNQRNFGPVEEIGEETEAVCMDGEVPSDFPLGVLIRNGPNPLCGGLLSTTSMFGKSSQTWVEGDGMVHAVYFRKDGSGNRILAYNNKYVESETFEIEKQRNKPCFLPAVEGDSLAILAAYVFNFMRYGEVNKYMSNTNVIEHAGKTYTIAENYVPIEVDFLTLETGRPWNIADDWNHPFTSHPKKAPETGELVVMGIDAKKPYYVLGVISANGERLSHKVDLGFDRSVLSHEIGVTLKYNVIIDHPLIFDLNRLAKGGPLLKYDNKARTRIGVMPRYGDAASVKWFDVENSCIFHIFNCFEDGKEVVVTGCKALTAVFPGPDHGMNKFEWFSRGFNFADPVDGAPHGYLFTRAHKWRLNMETGEVVETALTGKDSSMDFPFINTEFTGLKNMFGYAQVVDSQASSKSAMAKYGALAKLHFEETTPGELDSEPQRLVKVQYHDLGEHCFCSGSIFVHREGGTEEDDGWVVSWVHNEESDESHVYIIDAKKFEEKPVAKIAMPQRVPYGFHGTFIRIPNCGP